MSVFAAGGGKQRSPVEPKISSLALF